MARIELGPHAFDASSLEQPLFPDAGITLGDLLDYYRDMGAIMLPYLRERPLSTHCFPDGIHRPGFHELRKLDHFPEWIDTATVHMDDGPVACVVGNNVDTLIYLASQACITPHPWLSRVGEPHRPDRIVFDLDPPHGDGDHALVVTRDAARCLRDVLKSLELMPYLTTTGSRGLRVVVPIRPTNDFDTVRAFARQVAAAVARHDPERFTSDQRETSRGARLLIDCRRNAYARTSAAPYAVRALAGAPVATPLDWDELDDPDLHPQRYTLRNIGRRLADKPDPWIGMDDDRRDIARAREYLRRPAHSSQVKSGNSW